VGKGELSPRDHSLHLRDVNMEKTLIYTKISEVMAAVKAIGKDRKNIQQGYTFRGIDDMYNALNEHLANAKIFFTSDILQKEREERETAPKEGKTHGTHLIYTVLTIKWTIYAEDGSHVETVTVGEAMDSGDKSANKAMSAAYKYALMQVFCIPTDDPKDTENETHEVTAKKTELSATGARKVCVVCKKEFNPKEGQSWAKECTACYIAKKNAKPAELPVRQVEDENPFNEAADNLSAG